MIHFIFDKPKQNLLCVIFPWTLGVSFLLWFLKSFLYEQLSHGPNQWANEYISEREQHGSVDDQWVNEFSKLHVNDDWAEEFGQQVGQGVFGDGSADDWANAYDEWVQFS